MKKLYILFALLLVLTLLAGCKKHDKEVFTSDSLEYLSSLAQMSSKQDTDSQTPTNSSATEGTQQSVTSSQGTVSVDNNGSSSVETPVGSQPANSEQSSSDSLDLPVMGDNEISADELVEPELPSAPSSSSSQPEEAEPPTETPSEEQSSSSRPEVAPVSSDSEQWSPYF